jgi:acetyl esterase/lipase
VSIYAAPARATDLSDLPHAWIDVGSAELFRDENVAYASKLWECGVQAELHVWEGAWHAFDIYAAKAKVSKVALETRFAWIKRVFAGTEAQPAPQKGTCCVVELEGRNIVLRLYRNTESSA